MLDINSPIIHILGYCEYQQTWQLMHDFTQQRNDHTPDEIWLLQHYPVFTLGQAGKAEHVLNPGTIPVVKTNRGGQVTYHGPGQLVVYLLIDLRRLKLGIKQFVASLENTIINLLADFGLNAHIKPKAPGVYVNGAKICAIGLKISHGCSYHGIALNVDMDLEPFSRINPCGYKNLAITHLKNFIPDITVAEVQNKLGKYLQT